MAKPANKDVIVFLRLDKPTDRKLRELARKEGRTLSGQMRYMLGRDLRAQYARVPHGTVPCEVVDD